MYHILQQPSLISTHESISGMTPSLAALNDAPSLKQREWIRGEPGEDVPQQYSSIGGCLTPTMPRPEDMSCHRQRKEKSCARGKTIRNLLRKNVYGNS